jgi:hypothetical protein
VRAALARLGDAGLTAPVVAIAAGLLLPPAAELARALLLPLVLLLLAVSVALAEPGRPRATELPPVLDLVAVNLLLTPAFTAALAWLSGLSPWLILVAACPAAGSAALVAALLGLPMRAVLLAQLVSFAALPLTLPVVAATFVHLGGLDPVALFRAVALVVGGAGLLGLSLRAAVGTGRRLAAAPSLRGVGVLALCGLGLALGGDLPRAAAQLLGLGSALLGLALVSVVGAGLAAVAAIGLGAETARAFAVGASIRNVSLLWGAAAGLVPAEAEALLALGTFWTLVLPALLAWSRPLARLAAPGGRGASGATALRGRVRPSAPVPSAAGAAD